MRASKVSDFTNKKNLILIVLTCILFLFVIGLIYYLVEEKALKEEKYKELSTIAKIKLEQITDWREERVYEAEFFAKIDRLIKSTQGLINNRNDSEIKNYLQELLYPTKSSHGYENIFISDINSDILFSLDSIYNRADSITAVNISKSIKNDSLLFEDFHFCSVHNKIHLDIISPIKDYDNKIIAALIFRVNPADYFFSMIQKWPTYSKTAESILLKNEGHQIRILSQLRNNQNDKMLFTIPITEKKYVSVKGALGQKGIIEGKDYNNEDVIADLNSIPGTTWFIVTKMAREEFYSELIFRTIAITLLAIFILLLIVSTGFYLSKIRSNSIYKNLFLKEKELNEFQKISKAITDVAQDAIIMIDPEGNISFWNPAAEKILGYKPDEIMGKNLHNLIAPKHYHAQHQEAFNKFKVTGEGNAIGRVLILNAIKKNGDEIFIELALSAIKKNEDWHAVGIIRDISERKQTEEKLLESEEKFRKAFNTSTDSIIISRLSDGLLLDVNLGFCKITGFSKEDTVGKTIVDLGVWGDIKERDKVVQELMQNGAVDNFEAKFKTKDGKLIYGLFSASLIEIIGEPYIISITRDITERKKSEKKIFETQMMLNRIINLLPVRVFWKDKDFKYLGCNEIFAKDAGLNYPEEMLGKDDYQFSWKEQAPLYRADDKYVVETGKQRLDFFEPQTGPNQKLKWLKASKVPLTDADGKIIGVLGTYEDITQSKKTEEALQQSEELFRHSFNYSAAGMCIVGLDGKFQKVNDSFVKLLGYTETEIINYNFNDITYSEDITIGKSRFEMMLNREINNAEFEKRYVTKDKKVVWAHITTSLICDIKNQPHFIISQLIDITERKEMEKVLKASEENYRHIINGMNDMVFVIGLNGKFLDVNNSAAEILGYSKEELIQLGPADIDSSLSKDAILNLIEKIQLEEMQFFETSHSTKSGIIIPVEIKSTMIPYKGDKVILSIARDISERKEAHRIIMESEEKYRTMITQMQLGIAVHEIICDDNGTPVDYSFIDVNESFEKLTGLKKESIVGKRVLDIMPETESTWIEKYGYVALTGEPLQFEDYSKEMNKFYSVVAYRPRPMHFAVIIDDITDRKNSESELIERMNEISRFNNLMIGREEKMIELKKEINRLLGESGKEKKYDEISE